MAQRVIPLVLLAALVLTALAGAGARGRALVERHRPRHQEETEGGQLRRLAAAGPTRAQGGCGKPL